MKKYLHNVAERIKSRLHGRTKTQYEIEWHQEDVQIKWLTIENEAGSFSFLWDSVLAVDTFKRDYGTTDCICLAFETPDGWFEVNEEMKGWSEFLDVVESRLVGFPPFKSWWRKVAFPAFEANHERLWTKGQKHKHI